jgi:hypothetical protein
MVVEGIQMAMLAGIQVVVVECLMLTGSEFLLVEFLLLLAAEVLLSQAAVFFNRGVRLE